MMDAQFQKYYDLIEDYIKKNLDKVLKQPRSFIKYPFVDPGSVYDGNVWDWDTFWSVYSIAPVVKRMGDKELEERFFIHAKGNVHNFFDHQLEDGYIPMMIEVADWPEPYLNMKHKEGIKMNMHKPFLCSQICLISNHCNDYLWAAKYKEPLARYFKHYKENYYNENCGLYVWEDDIMIGMDNDPASFGRSNNSTANIYLNSFMVRELKNYVQYLKKLNEDDAATIVEIEDHIRELINHIQEECYDNRDKFFYSVDVDIKTRKFDWFHQGLGVFWKTLPIKIRVWSGFLPMWEGFATKEQAEELVKHYKDEATFHSPYGVATLAKDEKMFDLSVTNNPSNWLGPIWLVANYVVFRALLNYGYREEAVELCKNTLTLLGQDIEKTGVLHEYYNPFDGTPIMNGGFVNWNILALNMVEELGFEL